MPQAGVHLATGKNARTKFPRNIRSARIKRTAEFSSVVLDKVQTPASKRLACRAVIRAQHGQSTLAQVNSLVNHFAYRVEDVGSAALPLLQVAIHGLGQDEGGGRLIDENRARSRLVKKWRKGVSNFLGVRLGINKGLLQRAILILFLFCADVVARGHIGRVGEGNVRPVPTVHVLRHVVSYEFPVDGTTILLP